MAEVEQQGLCSCALWELRWRCHAVHECVGLLLQHCMMLCPEMVPMNPLHAACSTVSHTTIQALVWRLLYAQLIKALLLP